MAQFKFEGDLDILTEVQVKLVESVLQKQGFKDGKVLVEPVGQKGDNYVAQVKRFIYEADDGTTFKMIGKIAPVAEEFRVMMKTTLLFNNEIVMYNSVIPKFNNIQNSAGITEDEKVRFPVCYGIVSEAPYEFILLEDLKEAGFEMLDRFQPLSDEHIRLVIKDMARYHSLSYVFRSTEPEIYENISSKMLNMWSLMDGQPVIKQLLEITENDLAQLMDNSSKYRTALSGTVTQIAPIARKFESYEKQSKHTVIQQGDCWSNNILFRLDEGKAVEDVMIDYQMAKNANPAADLLYLIFNCTDHATRLQHYHDWIDYYHNSLDDALNNHGLKASRIFPKDQLDADLKRYGRLMISVSLLLSSVLIRESKDAIDLTNIENFTGDNAVNVTSATLNTDTINKLKERIRGTIDSAREFGLIKLKS